MNAPTVKEIRKVVERIYDHDADAHISAWHVREALRMIVDRLEALEKQNGDDHG